MMFHTGWKHEICPGDGGVDRCGNTAETEDDKYRPPTEVVTQPSSRPARHQTNPTQGEPTTTMTRKNPVNQSTSTLQAPPPNLPKSTIPRVVAFEVSPLGWKIWNLGFQRALNWSQKDLPMTVVGPKLTTSYEKR
ncbi:hypothetical protein BY996DRAFT_6535014 [Phakopsora pachyrhizi]|nr:hypothetical protein BY996DRAFT_6535014 [Phakopsora pachyrhizi]